MRDRMARLAANPVRAAALAKARQRLGKWMSGERLPQRGLAALRLNAGLSQQQLAEKLATQQSNISRWERNPGDLQLSTIRSLAAALNVSIAAIVEAVESADTGASDE